MIDVDARSRGAAYAPLPVYGLEASELSPCLEGTESGGSGIPGGGIRVIALPGADCASTRFDVPDRFDVAWCGNPVPAAVAVRLEAETLYVDHQATPRSPLVPFPKLNESGIGDQRADGFSIRRMLPVTR